MGRTQPQSLCALPLRSPGRWGKALCLPTPPAPASSGDPDGARGGSRKTCFCRALSPSLEGPRAAQPDSAAWQSWGVHGLLNSGTQMSHLCLISAPGALRLPTSAPAIITWRAPSPRQLAGDSLRPTRAAAAVGPFQATGRSGVARASPVGPPAQRGASRRPEQTPADPTGRLPGPGSPGGGRRREERTGHGGWGTGLWCRKSRPRWAARRAWQGAAGTPAPGCVSSL